MEGFGVHLPNQKTGKKNDLGETEMEILKVLTQRNN